MGCLFEQFGIPNHSGFSRTIRDIPEPFEILRMIPITEVSNFRVIKWDQRPTVDIKVFLINKNWQRFKFRWFLESTSVYALRACSTGRVYRVDGTRVHAKYCSPLNWHWNPDWCTLDPLFRGALPAQFTVGWPFLCFYNWSWRFIIFWSFFKDFAKKVWPKNLTHHFPPFPIFETLGWWVGWVGCPPPPTHHPPTHHFHHFLPTPDVNTS